MATRIAATARGTRIPNSRKRSAPASAPTNIARIDSTRRPLRAPFPAVRDESAARPVIVNVRTVVVRPGTPSFRTVALRTPSRTPYKSQGQSEGAEKLMVGAAKPVLDRFGALLRLRECLFRRCVSMLDPSELGVGESDPVRHLDAEGLDLGLVEKLDREEAAVPMEIAGADTLRAERGRPQELDPVRGRCGLGLPRHEKARHEVRLHRLAGLARGGNDVGSYPRVAHADADLRRLPVGLRLGTKGLFLKGRHCFSSAAGRR